MCAQFTIEIFFAPARGGPRPPSGYAYAHGIGRSVSGCYVQPKSEVSWRFRWELLGEFSIVGTVLGSESAYQNSGKIRRAESVLSSWVVIVVCSQSSRVLQGNRNAAARRTLPAACRTAYQGIKYCAVIHKMCSDNLRLCSDKGLFVQWQYQD